MSTVLLPVLRQRFDDNNGAPLAGGQLFSYVAGTSTPAATYKDISGGTPNTNPVVLDANGYADIWLGTGSYKFILEDSLGNVLWTVDNISATGSASAPSSWVKHTITDGQAAADLTAETVDFSAYTSAYWDVEIIRGTTVIANGQVAVQNLNGTGRVEAGLFMAGEAHGVTFSVSQAGLVCQLRAACSSGPGAGTIKMRKNLVAI